MKCKLHKNIEECRRAFNHNRRPYKESDDECPFLAVKTMIVSMRRKPNPNLFKRFRTTVINNLDILASKLSSRWILSIVETFADGTDPTEAALACTISMFMNMERLAATHRLICPPAEYKGSLQRATIWDGHGTLSMGRRADAHYNAFRRIDREISKCSHLHRFWRELFFRSLKSEKTTLHLLNTCHSRNLVADIKKVLK